MLDILYTECYFIYNCKRLRYGVLCFFTARVHLSARRGRSALVFLRSKCKRLHFALTLRHCRLFVLGFSPSGGCMKMFSYLGRFGFFALLLSLCSVQISAQFRSGIEGTVTDSSGGVVADAEVTLTNVDTSISRTVPSNAEGIFRFPSLGPGHYKVTV